MDVKALLWLLCFLPVALGSDYRCLRIRGNCQRDSLYCAGSYVSGKCSGGFHRRCCVPEIANGDSKCAAVNGKCQFDRIYCSRSYISGLCGGGSRRRCCISATNTQGCTNVHITSRAEWDALAPKHTSAFRKPARFFIIHHTGTNTCHTFKSCAHTVRGIQRYHMFRRGWNDIGYSFLIGQDGSIFEGRGWNNIGAHTRGFNTLGYAAAFIGNFQHKIPSVASLTAVRKLITCGVRQGYISKAFTLLGHRDVSSTSSPGDVLYTIIKSWPNYTRWKK